MMTTVIGLTGTALNSQPAFILKSTKHASVAGKMFSRDGIRLAGKALAKWVCSAHPLVKASVLAVVVWRALRLYRSHWQETRAIFDGDDDIAFCTHCSPELIDDSVMTLGNAYEKRFYVPNGCERCSCLWQWRGWSEAKMRIGNSQYQYLGTYSALRMQKDRDVHCPAVNQLDVTSEYRFAHRFMQLHSGTLGRLEKKRKWLYSAHTRSYCMSSLWHAIPGGSAKKPSAKPPSEPEDGDGSGSTTPPAPLPTPSHTVVQRMRQLWQFATDNSGQLPQSTIVRSVWRRVSSLFGANVPITDLSPHFRSATIGTQGRLEDSSYMSPPAGQVMAPVPLESAQAVGPVTHPVTIHNAQDRVSVAAALEGRSEVKKSVFPDANGEYPPLSFKKSSAAAQRLNKFWKKFNLECLTDAAIDQAYQVMFADKTFKEIAMSKFSQDEIEQMQMELQTTVAPEELRNRKANGKLESVMKAGKPARLVVDNTLQLLAINIISVGIFQHILFDEEDGIFHSMSIKHRAREEVLDGFSAWMQDPWSKQQPKGPGRKVVNPLGELGKALAAADNKRSNSARAIPTCCWEIDQTGMELHERCNRHGEGLLGYTYNALMRINNHVSHKINGEFTGLHEAKIAYDVKTGMRLRFRIRCPTVPKDAWFTAKFPDMYLDSGWALTSGVNFINELSGVYASIVENPQHLFAVNPETKRFRLQDGTFDWKFKSIPLYQTSDAPAPASFDIYLRGLFEGDDGGGAASQCLADPRNGGQQGLIIRQQEDLGYSAKLKTIISGRVEIIGAHFPVQNGLVCDDVPWIPAVQRYTSKLGVQTNVNITPSSTAARFLSLASMFAGRNEPLQRAFEQSAIRIIEEHGSEKQFWSRAIRTNGYHEIDRAFGTGEHCTYTMDDVKKHYDRVANKVHQPSHIQVRMLNMSIAEDVNASVVTREDYCKLCIFANECRTFGGDHESAYSMLPACFR